MVSGSLSLELWFILMDVRWFDASDAMLWTPPCVISLCLPCFSLPPLAHWLMDRAPRVHQLLLLEVSAN